jgi:hypothetical protein
LIWFNSTLINASLNPVTKDTTGTPNSVIVYVTSKDALSLKFGTKTYANALALYNLNAQNCNSGTAKRVHANANLTHITFIAIKTKYGIQINANVSAKLKKKNVQRAYTGLKVNVDVECAKLLVIFAPTRLSGTRPIASAFAPTL